MFGFINSFKERKKLRGTSCSTQNLSQQPGDRFIRYVIFRFNLTPLSNNDDVKLFMFLIMVLN